MWCVNGLVQVDCVFCTLLDFRIISSLTSHDGRSISKPSLVSEPLEYPSFLSIARSFPPTYLAVCLSLLDITQEYGSKLDEERRSGEFPVEIVRFDLLLILI